MEIGGKKRDATFDGFDLLLGLGLGEGRERHEGRAPDAEHRFGDLLHFE